MDENEEIFVIKNILVDQPSLGDSNFFFINSSLALSLFVCLFAAGILVQFAVF